LHWFFGEIERCALGVDGMWAVFKGYYGLKFNWESWPRLVGLISALTSTDQLEPTQKRLGPMLERVVQTAWTSLNISSIFLNKTKKLYKNHANPRLQQQTPRKKHYKLLIDKISRFQLNIEIYSPVTATASTVNGVNACRPAELN
jgi:hypothetical protein